MKKPFNQRGAFKIVPGPFVLGALLLTTFNLSAEMRTWNLKSGSTMEAEIVSFPDAQTVKVKRSDGKVYTLPDAYLADDDKAFLDAERAKQWKEASVDKILGSASGGRYKKCSVTGKEVSGQIFVTMLPAQVEPILKKRQESEAQIAAMNDRIQQDESTAHPGNSAPGANGKRARNAAKAAAKAAAQDESVTKTNLTKLKADYDAYVKKTKPTTTLMMRNTGIVYEGYQVWECQPQRKL